MINKPEPKEYYAFSKIILTCCSRQIISLDLKWTKWARISAWASVHFLNACFCFGDAMLFKGSPLQTCVRYVMLVSVILLYVFLATKSFRQMAFCSFGNSLIHNSARVSGCCFCESWFVTLVPWCRGQVAFAYGWGVSIYLRSSIRPPPKCRIANVSV